MSDEAFDLIDKAEQEVEQKQEEQIDVSQFGPITSQELIKILGLTIKKDEVNKLITFLTQLSCYTEDAQLNISFNAPSSSGKSFIPMEIAKLFPEEDVVEVGYCSPTAFFHDQSSYDPESKSYRADLSRKILIFLDQPHTQLLEHLRPLLSHDKKVIELKITDKNQRQGLRTKNIKLIGFPVVIFCTVGLNLDEQETTRFLLLSPETNQEKIREAISERIKRESNVTEYQSSLDLDPVRKMLKDRIKAIKQAGIKDVKIASPQLIQKLLSDRIKIYKPRHQRDVGRIINLIKTFALLNLWFRERQNGLLVANEDDVREAFKLWDSISESQELNLPPYVFNLFKEVIVPAYTDKYSELGGGVKLGVSRNEILKKHFEVYQRHLADWQLRQQIIPVLETSGLIYQEENPLNKREKLTYPTTRPNVSTGKETSKQYSEWHGGVNFDVKKLSVEELQSRINTLLEQYEAAPDDNPNRNLIGQELETSYQELSRRGL
ncbi:MAG: hypothetical protein Q8P13_04830 [bacterium]|nr:hypothetical protein [bacterium]